MNKKAVDLTIGSPARVILVFCIPLLLSSVLQQFYNLVDMVVVGQFLGKDALAGVGATGSVNFLVVGFCLGIAYGFVIPVAQRFGAKDYSDMRSYIANGIWTAAAFAVVITVAVCIFCREILVIMNTPENILDDAYDYIFIIFAGIPITVAYNFISGILRSIGDSKSPFYILLAASVVNIGFDIISVTVFHMGIKGPAFATLLSQLFSVIACYIVLKKNFPIVKIEKAEWKLDLHKIGVLCSMGIPMGLQYSITAIGSVVLQVGINSLGSDAVAAVTAGGKVSGLLSCVTDALGSTMATYAGQNIGAKKVGRIREGVKEASKIGILYSLTVFVLILFTGKYLLLMFLNGSETAIIAEAVKWLRITVAFYILLTFVNVVRFTIQGLGYSSLAICSGIMEMIARTLVGVVLVPVLGFTGVCFAHPAAWIFADAFLIPAYLLLMKRVEEKYGSRR